MYPSRVLLLDITLVIIFVSTYLSEYFIKHQVERFERDDIDYLPVCTPEKITATSPKELLVQRDSNVTTAVNIVEKHGVGFFEDLLSQEQAAKLREYILQENKSAGRRKEFVLDGKNRDHLTFGIDENPIVADAVHEIVTSQPLRDMMEQVLGEDAALVELASITAYPGAAEQDWHEDTDNAEGVVQLYSLFIPLQPTTHAMGATGLCAGTHTCTEFDFEGINKGDACGDLAIYAEVDKAGTGAFMNSLLYHKGSANTDTEGNVRVMFYLSWAESPNRDGTNSDRVLPDGGK